MAETGRRRWLGMSLPTLATILAALVVVLAAALIPLLVLSRQSVSSNADQLAEFLPMAAVGFIVARRQPRNPIGWLLLGTPAVEFLTGDSGSYFVLVYRQGRHLPLGWVALLLSATFLAVFVTLPLVVLLFRTAGCRRRAGAGCCGATSRSSAAWSRVTTPPW
jgi:hypothetical protein